MVFRTFRVSVSRRDKSCVSWGWDLLVVGFPHQLHHCSGSHKIALHPFCSHHSSASKIVFFLYSKRCAGASIGSKRKSWHIVQLVPSHKAMFVHFHDLHGETCWVPRFWPKSKRLPCANMDGRECLKGIFKRKNGKEDCNPWWLIDFTISLSVESPMNLYSPIGSMYGIYTYIYHTNQPSQ